MKSKGFSLIELIFVLAIIGSLALFSGFAVSTLQEKNEGQIIINELKTAIQFSKMQAVRMGQPVVLVPFDGHLNWALGMRLLNYDKTQTLYEWQWHYPHWQITWSGVHSTNKITLSNNPISAISNGTFTLVNSISQERKDVVLNRMGRIVDKPFS